MRWRINKLNANFLTFQDMDKSNNPSFEYFSEHPISEWSFSDFKASYNENKSSPVKDSKIKNLYLIVMDNIQSSDDTPEFAKTEARSLIESLKAPKVEPQNINYNITANDSSTINA